MLLSDFSSAMSANRRHCFSLSATTTAKRRGCAAGRELTWPCGRTRRASNTFPIRCPIAFTQATRIATQRLACLRTTTHGNGEIEFIVLSPYWYSANSRDNDSWGLTLGKNQYDWLKKTLGASKAKYIFIFIHQLAGGLDNQGRGGAEAAVFGEWGGRNPDGSDGFESHRPGWEMPIHPLLVRNGVTMVFHGHDHLFAKQDLDGIVYQEVPQPSDPRPGPHRSAEEYGYKSGVILASSGHMRITVSSAGIRAEYVRSALGTAQRKAASNGDIAYSYTVFGPNSATRDSTPQTPASLPASSRQDASKAGGNQHAGQRTSPRNAGVGGQGRGRDESNMPLPADVAEQKRLSIVLGRPTGNSITLNVLSADGGDAYVEYGRKAAAAMQKTDLFPLASESPAEIRLEGLAPDSEWQYRLCFRKSGSDRFIAGPANSFFTQRAPGSTFAFEIQGD